MNHSQTVLRLFPVTVEYVLSPKVIAYIFAWKMFHIKDGFSELRHLCTFPALIVQISSVKITFPTPS